MPADSVPASDRVRREWLRRVEAEYRSAAITQHLTLWLIQIGASPDLIRDGLRIVEDELAHSELSHETYLAAGGTGAPELGRDTLGLRRSDKIPLEHDVVRVGVRVFCLGETVAVRLFSAMRAGCDVTSARAALDRVLLDEVRHRDFGWTLLDWLSDLPLWPELRKIAVADLSKMFSALREGYGKTGKGALPDADRRWGLIDNEEYVAAVRETFERDYVPRFERVGIDAKIAWK